MYVPRRDDWRHAHSGREADKGPVGIRGGLVDVRQSRGVQRRREPPDQLVLLILFCCRRETLCDLADECCPRRRASAFEARDVHGRARQLARLCAALPNARDCTRAIALRGGHFKLAPNYLPKARQGGAQWSAAGELVGRAELRANRGAVRAAAGRFGVLSPSCSAGTDRRRSFES